MRILAILPAFVLLLLFACGKRNANTAIEVGHSFENTTTLAPTGDRIYFLLDSLTPIESSFIQYVNLEDTGYLFRLNPLTNTIYAYSIDNPQHVKTIPLTSEGPNDVGKITGFLVHSWDSIFVHSHKFHDYVSLVNREGALVERLAIFPDENESIGYLGVSNLSPMVLKNNQLYLVCRFPLETVDGLVEEFQSKQAVVFDIRTREPKLFLTYTSPYTDAVWGGEFFRIALAYHVPTEQLLFGFGAADSLKVADLSGNITARKFAGSRFMEGLRPLQQSGEYQPENMYEHAKEIISRGQYGKLVYDQHSGYTYRLVRKPISRDVIDNAQNIMTLTADWSVVILDKELNRVGETSFETSAYVPNMFSTEAGIYIKEVSSQSEDTLWYERFVLQPLLP